MRHGQVNELPPFKNELPPFKTADECRRLAYEAWQAATGVAPRQRGFLVSLAVEYGMLARAIEREPPFCDVPAQPLPPGSALSRRRT